MLQCSKSEDEMYLSESQHVKVSHVVFIGMSYSLLAFLRVDQLADVLHDKITLNINKDPRSVKRNVQILTNSFGDMIITHLILI